MAQGLKHQPLHDAPAGVFRIGAHAGDKADGIHRTVNIGLQGIDRHLGDQGFSVEAAQHVRALQHGKFGLLDFVVLPAGVHQFLFGYLEGVSQKRVILLQILGGQGAYGVILNAFAFVHGVLFSFEWDEKFAGIHGSFLNYMRKWIWGQGV